MIAVSWSSYEKSGCINCGCEYCYNNSGLQGGGTADVTCGECGKQFVILADGLTKSRIGYGTNRKDAKGETIFEYPTLQEHPRKDIPKHKYVRPDVRPVNGIGEFCNPRGVGYDVACFVKSKEAGQRITDMINKINEEYDNKGFSCWLDYREREPNWIQVKINYPNELRATFLCGLISENNNIITEEIVKKAMDMEIDFTNYWNYQASGRVYNAIDSIFIHSIVGNYNEFTKKQRDKIYDESFQMNNYLDQFEVWGAYKQMGLELSNGNEGMAVSIARHLIDLNRDHFNYELVIQRGKERDYITDLRSYFHDELVKSVNIYYEKNNQLEKITDGKLECDYDNLKECIHLEEEEKRQFVLDWQKFVPILFNVIDLEVIKLSTAWKDGSKEKVEKEQEMLSKYPNLFGMFSLFGLYVQVSRNIEEGNIEIAVLAIDHVASQMYSPLFRQIQSATNNKDSNYLAMQVVYAEIGNMASKYYNRHIDKSLKRNRI